MTGVYDAYAGKLGHENVKLEIMGERDLELFTEYVEVIPDGEKSSKVLRTIRRELGLHAYECICQAAANRDGKKADAIFRTIVLGLRLPKDQRVMNCLTEEYVCTVAQLSKKTWNEAHTFMGFTRFTELAGGILYAEIEAKHEVLPIIAPHFANRYPEEHWVIYDSGREKFVVHRAGKDWMIVEDCLIAEEVKSRLSMDEEDYRAMWKSFHESIAIEARKNEQLQKQLLPLRFRDKMTEFERSTSILE